MYSTYVSFILGCSVIAGATRTIVAKLFYQFGFENPLFLILLSLAGQAFSLVIYNIWRYSCVVSSITNDSNCNSRDDESSRSCTLDHTTTTISQRRISPSKSSQFTQAVFTSQFSTSEGGKSSIRTHTDMNAELEIPDVNSSGGILDEEEEVEEEECHIDIEGSHIQNITIQQTKSQQIHRLSLRPIGESVSKHGLPSESRTKKYISCIPWYLKPLLPALFNFLAASMRWTSLLFVAASIAEMLISGMELVLSVLAARCVRGRRITWVRWAGVGIVSLGIMLVGIFDTQNASTTSQGSDDNANVNTNSQDQVIGILLILGQCISSVLQDVSEEVMLHEADFPPALLIGMEGLFGLVVALILYFPLAPIVIGEHQTTALQDLQSNTTIVGLSIGWALLVTVTSIFDTAATGVTSSMTRNVWKNIRTGLIWIVNLIIFYATGNPELGEEWFIPGSFYILIGFAVMLSGVSVYYGKGSRA